MNTTTHPYQFPTQELAVSVTKVYQADKATLLRRP